MAEEQNCKEVPVSDGIEEKMSYKEMEEMVRESEGLFKALLDTILDAVLILDWDGNILFANPAAVGLVEADQEPGAGEFNIVRFLDREYVATALRDLELVRQGRGGFLNRYRIWTSSGREKWVEGLGTSINFRGRLANIVTLRETTQAVAMEKEVKRQSDFLRSMADNIPDLIWAKDMEGRFLFVNQAMCKVLLKCDGPDEAIGKTDLHFALLIRAQGYRHDFGEMCVNSDVMVHQTGKPAKFEEYGYVKGDFLYLEVYKAPLFDGQGAMVGTVGCGRDITEKKAADQAVLMAEEKYRSIFENAVEGIFQSTPEGHLIAANPALARIYGYDTAAEFVGAVTSIDNQVYANPSDRLSFKKAMEQKGEVRDFETEVYRKDGGRIWVSVTARAVKDSEGHTLFYEGANIDVTDRKRQEEAVQRSNEYLNRVLAGIVDTLASITEWRDPYTAGHQRRVTGLACAIAGELGWEPEVIETIHIAGLLHDIGKIAVPAEILSKPGRLSDAEFTIIKTHSETGYNMLKAIPFRGPVAQIVLQHHERVDGSGYPKGVGGDEIYREAKLLAIADTVESMASHRPYRPARGIDMALEEIERNRGSLYDPDIVAACIRLIRQKGFSLD
jgi:PAS domain S-box-containing protein/putative nucleotidyltransferase with HDIG domain